MRTNDTGGNGSTSDASGDAVRVCMDCSFFIPDRFGVSTEFGICLREDEFEPFTEELMEDRATPEAMELVMRRKFRSWRNACDHFDEAEVFEIDDESALGRIISNASDPREIRTIFKGLMERSDEDAPEDENADPEDQTGRNGA